MISPVIFFTISIASSPIESGVVQNGTTYLPMASEPIICSNIGNTLLQPALYGL